MSDRRRGLGKGLGALIPVSSERDRPSDVFFPRGPGSPVGRQPGDRLPTAEELVGSADALPAHGRFTRNMGPEGGDGGDDQLEAGSDRAEDQTAPVPTEALAEGLAPVPGAAFAEVPVEQIRPNPHQPRDVFDEDELSELVSSIRELGILQPVVVRAVPATDGTGDGAARPAYELVMGERRLRAAKAAGKNTIPAIIRVTEDEHMLRDALLENLHRVQLNPLEEAAAYQQLLEDFGCTHDELAGRIGRSRPQISNTIRLLKLPPMVQRRVASSVLSAGHARALLGLQDGAAMERLAQRIVAEGLSVRSVEEIVVLGGEETPAPRRSGSRATPGPELQQLAERLSEQLETRVQVAMSARRGKGRITVEFAGQQDLDRILQLLERS